MTICLTQKTCRVKLITLIVGLVCCCSAMAGAAAMKHQDDTGDKQAAIIFSGRFQGFTMDKVYIEGLGIKLADDVEMYSENGDKIHKNKFKSGCLVKFVIGPDKEIEMMQIEQQPR